ncbi:MAG: RNA polymerase sigma factor, partial [Candidatus Sungbacteria bacterium]|nr:RNA polymerase sigma factor [Candidatus Sungbacteria bacterium]
LHYFFTIARNTFIDYLRRQKHAVLPITDEVLKNTADSAAESARAAEKRETAQTVKSALLKLTEEQQEIIIMKFINELSNREIAAILGKSEEAVRQLQYRALKALRRQMPIR